MGGLEVKVHDRPMARVAVGVEIIAVGQQALDRQLQTMRIAQLVQDRRIVARHALPRDHTSGGQFLG